MTHVVPKEVSHVFEWVKKAKRFSVFPNALSERYGSEQDMQRYIAVCKTLFKEAKSIGVFNVQWNRDSSSFNHAHSLMEERLARSMIKGTAATNTVLAKSAEFSDIEFLWSRCDVMGVLNGVVVMEIPWPSRALVSLFACSSEPKFAQGANEGLRAAINRAKRIAENEATVAAIFRGNEIEIFAEDLLLAEAFASSYEGSNSMCRKQ